MSVSAHTLNTAHGFEMLRVAEIDKCVQPSHSFNNDIAALAAIAAVGAAILNVFLAPKTDRAGATCARTDKNFSLVKKVHVVAFRGEWRIWPVLGSLPVMLNLFQHLTFARIGHKTLKQVQGDVLRGTQRKRAIGSSKKPKSEIGGA